MSDHEILYQVGRGLRSVRQSQGLTLEEASEKTGVAPAVIGSYERGDRNPSITQLARLADGYGVTVSTFLPDHQAEPTLHSLGDLIDQVRDLREFVEACARRDRQPPMALVGDEHAHHVFERSPEFRS